MEVHAGVKLVKKEQESSFKRMDKCDQKIVKRVLNPNWNFLDGIEMSELKRKLSSENFRKWEKEESEAFVVMDELRNSLEFDKIFYHSFVISAYSVLEHTLNDACREMENMTDLKLSDINGKGIQRAQRFLEKVCKIKLPDKRLQEEVLEVGLVRNTLAHNGGQIEEKLIPVVKKNRHLRGGAGEGLFFDEKYCVTVIRTIDKYLSSLVKLNKKVFIKILI